MHCMNPSEGENPAAKTLGTKSFLPKMDTYSDQRFEMFSIISKIFRACRLKMDIIKHSVQSFNYKIFISTAIQVLE